MFYAFIGSVLGIAAHLFNGVVQEHIHFNTIYVLKLIYNFLKLSLVLILTVVCSSFIILMIPNYFLLSIGTDSEFLHHLVYYLYAFAAFDFTLEHVVEKKGGMELK